MKKTFMLAIILILATVGPVFARELKAYFPDGKLKSLASYNNKDQLNGVYKNYWSNGRLREQGRYKDGALVPGSIRRYSVDGVLLGK